MITFFVRKSDGYLVFIDFVVIIEESLTVVIIQATIVTDLQSVNSNILRLTLASHITKVLKTIAILPLSFGHTFATVAIVITRAF